MVEMLAIVDTPVSDGYRRDRRYVRRRKEQPDDPHRHRAPSPARDRLAVLIARRARSTAHLRPH